MRHQTSDIRHQTNPDLATAVGLLRLRSPLIAASGTVGSVVELAGVADLSVYGAAVAKSVSAIPWEGRPAPRLAPVGLGMLNGIGIQNPGIEAWSREVGPRLAGLDVPVWGSTVGHDAEEFAQVAIGLEVAGVSAIEINLSCPNLEGRMFSLDASAAAEVTTAVRAATTLPIGAKLSPNLVDPVPVTAACVDAGVDFVTLTNTIWGAGIDLKERRPLLSGVIGGYSGPALKPIALRFVIEVHRALPQLPIVGCGGVVTGADIVEFLIAGASAVAAGTVHLAEPQAGRRLLSELISWMRRNRVRSIAELVGTLR
ncbi:MAG: dihydroorotate dehydrogenase [Acidimicrobiia bacterium]|nr:dihydroorotate dehydrogenase [Acidimicrobiia bacterium]MDQ3501414.1 dihydroorotate dehydrogenase [Actinomycetota bacterium]